MLSNLDWSNWLRGLIAAVVGGGANSVLGAGGLSATGVTKPEDFYTVVMTLFGSGAIISFFMFLKQNPVPAVVETIKSEMVKTREGETTLKSEKTTTTQGGPPEPKPETEIKKEI